MVWAIPCETYKKSGIIPVGPQNSRVICLSWIYYIPDFLYVSQGMAHQGNAPVRTVTGCISILGMYFQNTSETHPLLPRRYTNSSQTWEINHGVGHSL